MTAASRPNARAALALLDRATETNPGSWHDHSLTVGRAAAVIAEKSGLDAERARALGLLHDIGRYEGVRGMHHIIAGYRLLMDKGWDEAARVCITHSFPTREIDTYVGEADVTADELREIEAVLAAREPDDYDRLIQLCDAIALPQGVAPMEARLFDVALRHGPFEGIERKWQGYFDIKARFDRLCGCNLFSLFEEDIARYARDYARP